MKISYNWIKELLPELSASAQEVGEKLTYAGVEVESITIQGKGLESVVVAKVLEKNKHPNADRLNVCLVDDGTNKVQIVCGASNVQVGGIYPMAKVGAQLPNGLIIKKSAIRSVESSGMLCSAKELGLAEEASGLLELEQNAIIGTPITSYLGLNDTILEISITPNRGDCLSHLGLAFEIASLFNLNFNGIKSPVLKHQGINKLRVSIDSKNCHRYISAILQNVKVKPSPKKLSQRLEALGIRSINNVVDATNYIMLLTGHPVHAFSGNKIIGDKIVVNDIKETKSFKTLDGKDRKLELGDIVICDSNGPIALAGIMGGLNSEVSEETDKIILEVAAFSTDAIRGTARRLGLTSESSYRFERGVPAESADDAMQQLISLICELSGGHLAGEVLDVYPQRKAIKEVFLRNAKLSDLTGREWNPTEVTNILTCLHLEPKEEKEGWSVKIPVRRFDLSIEEDIIEEVVRYVGFEQIKSEMPRRALKKTILPKNQVISKILRSYFVSKGFIETIHYSFLGEADLKLLSMNATDCSKLANPLSEELSLLRPSLFPQLLHTAISNLRHQEEGARYFELRRVYLNGKESLKLAVLCLSDRYTQNWSKISQSASFYEVKGLINDVCDMGHIKPRYSDNKQSYLHPGQSVEFLAGNDILGFCGTLHPLILNDLGVQVPIAYAEVDMGILESFWKSKHKYSANLTDQPKNRRDLSLVVPQELTFNDLQNTILKKNVKYMNNINIFDIYIGQNIPEGCKSVSISIDYCDAEKTLTDEEVNEVHFKLVDDLKKQLQVTLR